VNKVKQFMTARRLSLSLILVLAGMMYLSTLIPQEMDSTPDKMEGWRRGHESLLWLVDGVNLHRIYAQPWFAAAILFAALALGVSSCEQLAVARRKLYATGIGAGEEVAASVSEQQLISIARSYRYRFIQTGSFEQLKFVRSPWGYFGNLLLHVGMALVIMVSCYVALTGRQGALILTEGERCDNQQPWNASAHGILTSPLKLPGTIRLDKVRVSFDSKNQPAEVSSEISITDGSGRVESLTASINRILRYHGLRIYHAAQYGDAFSVTFTDRAGVMHAEKIAIQQPVSLTKAGYSDDFAVSWAPYLLSAKYYADAGKESMLSTNPELTLRITDGKKEVARTTLTRGSSGMLGDYRVELNEVEKWAKLIIVDIGGMPVIFAGFAIIMLGGLLHYMTPPRELVGIRQQDGHYRVYWKATSFKDFFLDERDEMATKLQKGVS
jgi:cytochrome c biogenesis protein ResB